MAAHEPCRTWVSLLILTLAGACSQAPAPARPEPAQPPPVASPSAQPVPDTPRVERPVPLPEDRVVVIDPGDDEPDGERSLAQIARDEKDRRSRAAAPVAVITNKTLPAYAAKGQLTVATPGPQPESSPGDPAAESGSETSWRSRGLEIRRRWRAAVDEIARLEQSAADLRRRFYTEDDPYRRDGQIKPEWDRVLDHLEQKRTEAETAEADLERFLEEGRQAGALPGWLQEGADEEPPRKDPPPAPTEAIEPPELEAVPLGEGPP